jgi:hypothetical protein
MVVNFTVFTLVNLTKSYIYFLIIESLKSYILIKEFLEIYAAEKNCKNCFRNMGINTKETTKIQGLNLFFYNHKK